MGPSLFYFYGYSWTSEEIMFKIPFFCVSCNTGHMNCFEGKAPQQRAFRAYKCVTIAFREKRLRSSVPFLPVMCLNAAPLSHHSSLDHNQMESPIQDLNICNASLLQTAWYFYVAYFHYNDLFSQRKCGSQQVCVIHKLRSWLMFVVEKSESLLLKL